MKHLCLTLFPLFLSFASVAQDSAPPPRTYTVDFFIPKRTGIITDTTRLDGWNEVYVFDGQEERRLRLIPGRRSGSVTLQGNGEVLLYTRVEKKDPETGETLFERIPYLRTTLPESWGGAMVLLSKQRDAKGGRVGIPLQYDPGHIPNGSVRVLNMTSNRLALYHQNELKQLAPQQSTLYKGFKDTDRIELAIGEDRGDGWERAFDGVRPIDTESGNLLVLVPKRSNGGVRLLMFNGM